MEWSWQQDGDPNRPLADKEIERLVKVVEPAEVEGRTASANAVATELGNRK